MNVASLRRYLERTGYRIHVREVGWFECLLVRDAERWLGRGGTADEALLDAARAAFPSRAAWDLLSSAVDAAAIDVAPEQEVEPAPQAQHSEMSLAPVSDVGAMSRDTAVANDVTHDATVSTARETYDAAVSAARETDAIAVSASRETEAVAVATSRETYDGTVTTPPTDDAPNLAPAATPSAHDRRPPDPLAAVRELRDTITEGVDELGLCSPRRQRVQLNAWIAEARAIEDACRGEYTVEYAVRGVAGALTRFAKSAWPGRVAALGLRAEPLDAARDLDADRNREGEDERDAGVRGWHDVRVLAEEVLEEIEADDAARGLDEYGWADAAMCEPAPDDPDALLDTVAREIEALGGPLHDEPSRFELPHAEQLAHWVGMLRCLRLHVANARLWSGAMGRCRRWLYRERREFAVASERLQPEYSPTLPWSRVLGVTPRGAAATTHGASTPSAASAPPLEPAPPTDASDEALVEWIRRALPNAGARHDEIVVAMRPFAERLLAMDSDTLAGGNRHDRKRLSKLKAALGKREGDAAVGRGAAVRDGSPKRETSVEPDERTTLVDTFRLSVVARTRGKRALLVSNRDDVHLRENLTELLQFAEVRITTIEPRRVDAAASAVVSGKWHFVLGVTGFMDHRAADAIKTACDRAGVEYVRVARGRPMAVLRAVGRHLGVGAEGGEG